MALINLLNTTARVETPFVKVTIGDFTFGVFDKKTMRGIDVQGVYKYNRIQYPNYVQTLTITKINGKVNTYVLTLKYPINESNDPNFIEKVLSSVSQTRKIVFSYGDLSLPSFVYRDEEAIITNVDSQFGIADSTITYKISAVSQALKLNAGNFTFKGRLAKPSDVIKEILFNKTYGLQEIFYGMRDRTLVETAGLIPGNDRVVQLQTKTNITILEYLSYLVSCMSPLTSDTGKILKKSIYILSIVDDITGSFDGTYFKITQVGEGQTSSILETYEIDIGYPSQNVVISFQVNDNQNYSIFHDFTDSITNDVYVQRINDDGELESEFAPILSSSTELYKTTEAERTWWTKVTSYPISATLVLKGLLRPSILMTHVKLNVYFFGKKHIASGLYIITKQVDQVDTSGFRTTLTLTRVDSDKELLA
jgi:hypothetical protein